MNNSQSYDVVVVGARCTGAGTALLLARKGLRVLLVEKGTHGSDTLSTHALMRGGVMQLHKWGVLDTIKAAGTPCVQTTSFHYADEVIAIPIKPKDGVEGLYAPRRYLLDRVLVDAAVAAGAEVMFQNRVTDLLWSAEGRVAGVVVKAPGGPAREISARWVIGADGMRSTVAKLVDAPTYSEARSTTAVVYSYWTHLSDLPAGYHWYYRPGRSAGVIPSSEGSCIFISIPPERFRAAKSDLATEHTKVAGECDSQLASALAGGKRIAPYRGFAGQVGYMKQSFGPGWALVGDAGYFKDPITAHGITDGLIDASSLAEAIEEGSESALAEYQEKRDLRARDLFRTTDNIASFEWSLDELKKLHLGLSKAMQRESADL